MRCIHSSFHFSGSAGACLRTKRGRMHLPPVRAQQGYSPFESTMQDAALKRGHRRSDVDPNRKQINERTKWDPSLTASR